MPKHSGKPQFSTAGQSTKMRGSGDQQHGTGGQSTSGRNKPCKPHMGTIGQPKAGKPSTGQGPTKSYR